MTVKYQIKCATRGCHRRKRISLEERQRLRDESETAGQRAGLLCPACVKKALENPGEYDWSISLGEMVVEAARETPQWRLTFTPGGY